MIKNSLCEASYSYSNNHSHVFYHVLIREAKPPYDCVVKYMAVAVAVAVAVSGGGAVPVAGLTKRFFNHIQKDFLINVWVYARRTSVGDERHRRQTLSTTKVRCLCSKVLMFLELTLVSIPFQ